MNITKYQKHINPRNTFNPYSLYIRTSASITPIPATMLTNDILIGQSATDEDYNVHHIYEKNLFPVRSKYGIGTLRIRVSKDIHKQLHELLANAKSYEDFLKYEAALRQECPEMSEAVAQNYVNRIAALRSGILVYLAMSYGFIKRKARVWQKKR